LYAAGARAATDAAAVIRGARMLATLVPFADGLAVVPSISRFAPTAVRTDEPSRPWCGAGGLTQTFLTERLRTLY
jgi:hypothetical protein